MPNNLWKIDIVLKFIKSLSLISILLNVFVCVYTQRYRHTHMHTHMHTAFQNLIQLYWTFIKRSMHRYVRYDKKDNNISWILSAPPVVTHFNYHYILRALFVILAFKNILLKLASYFQIVHGNSDSKHFYFILHSYSMVSYFLALWFGARYLFS